MMARLHLQPQARGVGMTSQRVRDALVQRLREGIEDERGIVQAPIRDENVLNAIRTVPRHLFVDESLAARAYLNNALSIGNGQTISQPWFVARMTEAVMQSHPKKVLEIGTGSGYQAAVLAVLGVQVFTVERINDLLRIARKRFRDLGLNERIRSKHDDGRIGWSDHGPFDAIMVTAAAAAPALIEPLLEQLAIGGVLVAPVGAANEQKLLQLVRRDDGVEETILAAAAFVPLLSGTQD